MRYAKPQGKALSARLRITNAMSGAPRRRLVRHAALILMRGALPPTPQAWCGRGFTATAFVSSPAHLCGLTALGLQPLRVFRFRARSLHPIRPKGLPSNQQTLAAGQRLQPCYNRTASMCYAGPSRVRCACRPGRKKQRLRQKQFAFAPARGQNTPLGKFAIQRGIRLRTQRAKPHRV